VLEALKELGREDLSAVLLAGGVSGTGRMRTKKTR